MDFVDDEVGLTGLTPVPAVGVIRFDAARGMIVGLWAKTDVYAPDEATAVVRGVVASLP